MLRRKSAGLLLILSLLSVQLGCRGLLGDRSNEGVATAPGRPAPHFKPGFNLFTPEQDIELGKKSAQQIAQQVPLLRDDRINGYVQGLGKRLAAKAPGFPFTYQFAVIATKEINAFALPGGYIFVNAGTLAAAKNEGELAGVIAHEISHVALRHGTNQASKAYVAQRGIDILRTIAGGNRNAEEIITAIGGTGANMVFLKFGRTAETQADVEGVHIMAEAGYDPHDMANFFKTLQERSGQRVPEFLSDHPDPGNRIATINKEMASLRVNRNAVRNSDEFQQARALLTGGGGGPALKSTDSPSRTGPSDPSDNDAGSRPPAPSASMIEFQARDGSFALRYPDNWDALTSDDVQMIFAPRGAYGQKDDSVFVTHGLFVGAIAPGASDLETANTQFIQQQVEMNPDFKVARAPQAISFGGRRGYATVVAGPSAVTGVLEIDVVYTTATTDGKLFYLITMAPEDEFETYRQTFEQVIASLRLAG
ncbi:MAG TPA: M48 family metalloprotease [Pyrinomonadaceae bacterium]|jgi:predicted Zn-dependent protease|nr:M48 family metalloprotease [Pyrinomonadaceae bacterium]